MVDTRMCFSDLELIKPLRTIQKNPCIFRETFLRIILITKAPTFLDNTINSVKPDKNHSYTTCWQTVIPSVKAKGH